MKITTKVIGFILLSGFLASCNYARFDRMPGVKQEANSPEIQGTFEVRHGLFGGNKEDSFSVIIDNNTIKQITKVDSKESKMNVDYYLYQLNNYFVIGTPDNDFKALWNITLLEPVANGFRAYIIDEARPNPNHPSRIQPYLPEREMPIVHEPIQAMPGTPPTPPLGEAGGQSMLKYYTMNDELFLRYFEKEVKGKEFIFLKRVKVNQKGKKK